ncbi:MAG: YihY/virulence factor BrkB family protein [Polyangiaceae bacterium]|nr:YihY/virulence factor BrkB family protein [Polyangiaceae bacterium]
MNEPARKTPTEGAPRGVGGMLVYFWRGVRDHRVDGLAAEVAFFSLFALPPALLALFSAVGFVARALGPDVMNRVRAEVVEKALGVMTEDAVREMVVPTMDKLFEEGRLDLLSVGVLFALFSTSRAADTLLSALHVVYRLDERFAMWRRRGLAVLYTLVATVWGAVLMPLLVVGPTFARAVASRVGYEGIFETLWSALYWPVVIASVVLSLTAVYHFALPWRTPFLRDLPGALFAMSLWIGGSAGLRAYGRWTVESSPIYGALASPMILLLWLYFTAFALLMGAELNAAIEAAWPTVSRREKRDVLKQAVAELRDEGEDVAPVSVTRDPTPVGARKPPTEGGREGRV